MAGNANSGRNKLPDEVKKQKGTLRKSRVNPDEFKMEGLFKMPPPPKAFPKEVAKIWKNTGEELIKKGVLSSIDLPKFKRYCQLLYAYAKHEELLYSTTTPAVDFYKAISLSKALSELEARFGLDPVSRTKINVPVAGKVSKLKQKIQEAKMMKVS